MTHDDDAALWQAAHATMPELQREHMDKLHSKQQRGYDVSDPKQSSPPA